jgi:proline dehydrogenase
MILPIARQYIAGESSAAALEHARELNENGIEAEINLLGSHNEEMAAVDADTAAYQSLISTIGSTGLDAGISIKPTQLGLDVGEHVFRERLASIVDTAARHDVFVWLDMEEPETITPTIEVFEEFTRTAGVEMGICLQSDMKRTTDDIGRLSDLPGRVRLVKGGAYDVSASVAYTRKERVERAYRENLRLAFERFDAGIAVASHDPDVIEYAIRLADVYGTDFQFQMLMGTRVDAQRRLAEEYDVCQYVPYGPQWKRWVLNRTKNDAWFVVRHVFEEHVSGLIRTGDRRTTR